MKLETENRQVTVKTTDGALIRGLVNLNGDVAHMDRISDLLNKGQNPFLVVYNATVMGKEEATVIINKSHIVWLHPDDI